MSNKESLLNRSFSSPENDETSTQVEVSYRSHELLLNIFVVIISLVSLLTLGFVGFILYEQERRSPYISAEIESRRQFEIEIDQIYLAPTLLPDELEIDDSVLYGAFDPVRNRYFIPVNSEERVPVASITKLLTLLVAQNVYELDQVIRVQNDREESLPWGIGLEVGDSVIYEDLVKAMLLNSFNDAAHLVAEEYPDGGYDGFINEMNQYAQRLGMENSYFGNPSGLDDDVSYSTVDDLITLVMHFIERSEYVDYATSYYDQISVEKADGTVELLDLESTNQLLGTSPYIKGLKTGTTANAGQCFVGYLEADQSDRVITVILNSKDRFEETKEMIRYISENY